MPTPSDPSQVAVDRRAPAGRPRVWLAARPRRVGPTRSPGSGVRRLTPVNTMERALLLLRAASVLGWLSLCFLAAAAWLADDTDARDARVALGLAGGGCWGGMASAQMFGTADAAEHGAPFVFVGLHAAAGGCVWGGVLVLVIAHCCGANATAFVIAARVCLCVGVLINVVTNAVYDDVGEAKGDAGEKVGDVEESLL